MVECVGLENRYGCKPIEGSNPSLSAEIQANPGDSLIPPNTQKGTERTGKNLKGTLRMQIGCKQEATTEGGKFPESLARSWVHLPEHVKLAILALVEPYRHLGAGVG